MRIDYTQKFKKQFKRLPQEIQQKVTRMLDLLVQNPQYPSLRLHKMHGRERWEISVTRNYRITFEIRGNVYFLRSVGVHDILNKS